MKDVAIIGAGVCGCAVAKELSRYEFDVCVFDKNEDVCEGTSKANSGIVHGGFDAKPGSLKARLNVLGNRMMDEVCRELDIPFKRNGSMVLCWKEEEVKKLEALLEQGRQNKVPGMRILSREEAKEMEPNLSDDVYAALYVPTGGIVCPFELTIAHAEVACENGVEFRLGEEVLSVEKKGEGYLLHTTKGDVEARYVVNAAGVYADRFHNMVSEEKIHITARKGEYDLLDKTAGSLVSCTIFQLPTAMGKGVLVTQTVHGNLLLGPTAMDVEDKEAVGTTREGISQVTQKATLSVKNIPLRQVITSFAGLRAHEDGDDFRIGEVKDAPGFIDVAGIESPGLTSAPAIGVMVCDLLCGKENRKEKETAVTTRKGVTHFASLSDEEKAALIAEKPAFGRIVCRCETVTEGEILEAIHRPLGARTVDGVKRRTRAGMGRCQAGFCSPRTMEILAREWGVGMETIVKNEADSGYIVGSNKDVL